MDEKKQTTVNREEVKRALDNLKMSYNQLKNESTDSIGRVFETKKQIQRDENALAEILGRIGLTFLTGHTWDFGTRLSLLVNYEEE